MDDLWYQTDAQGRILAVNDAFRAFAEENHAPGLDQRVLGKYLEDIVIGFQVRSFSQKARQAVLDERLDQVRYIFRCDAPEKTRTLWMRITKEDAGARYTTRLIGERPQPEVPIWRALPREVDAEILRACMDCARIEYPYQSDTWVGPHTYMALDGPANVRFSHGYCPPCADHHTRLLGL